MARAGGNMNTALVVNLGCAKNLVDSEVLSHQVRRLGLDLVREPERAELIVVNTCGFLESAVEEAIETLLTLAKQKETGRCRKLVAVGCMVQRYGKKLLNLLPEVDLFLGTSQYGRFAEILTRTLDYADHRLVISRPTWLPSRQTGRDLSGTSFSAYVKVADGCDRHCSFCVIPRLRGPYRSRTVIDVVAEVRELAARGVKEINLVAQDTGAFGSDRKTPHELISLLEQLDAVPGVEWIRILYVYPDQISKALLQTMAQAQHIVPYLDMPLQHCVPRLMRAMLRQRQPQDLRSLIETIRTSVPGIALRTSLMVGFPGESESDFQELLQFVEWSRFHHLGVFTFSPEKGSRAARLPDRIAPDVARLRRNRVLELQARISKANLRHLIGQTLPTLIEGVHPETDLLLKGRLATQAPEVDGAVIITAGEFAPGQIVPLHITDSHHYDLVAEPPDIGAP